MVNNLTMDIVKTFAVQDTTIMNHSAFSEDALMDTNLTHLEVASEVVPALRLQAVKIPNTDITENASQNVLSVSTPISLMVFVQHAQATVPHASMTIIVLPV